MRHRLWLLLSALLLVTAPHGAVTAALADGVAATAGRDAGGDAGRGQPTIESDASLLDGGVRAAERDESLAALAPVLATDGALPRSTVGIPAPAACRAAGWSDVVQCRRWSGARLLRWATPPPARA